MSKHMKCTPRELLGLAVRIERNGEAYYLKMAEKAKQPAAKKMFEFLAAQERQHIVDFGKIITSLGADADKIPEAYKDVKVDGYLDALADGMVFPSTDTLENAAKAAKKITTDFEAALHALQFEKDAIIFFSEVLEMLSVDSADRKAVQELIRQEKIHIARLHTLVAQIQAEKEN